MSGSTSHLDGITQSQSGKEQTANNFFNAASPAALFARRESQSGYPTWAYYGGTLLIDGVPTTIANGTTSVTSNSTNYIEADRNGSVSRNTTGFTAGRMPLYTVVVTGSTISSYTDHRPGAPDFAGLLAKSMSDANTTLTAAEARNHILQFTGTLTAARNIVLPLTPREYTVFNNTTGGFSLTFIGASGTGTEVAAGARATIYADGTNIVSQNNSSLIQTIAYASTITPDAAKGERVIVGTLTGNMTINAPTNPFKGARLNFVLAQDATGTRTVTWNSVFKKSTDGAGLPNQKSAIGFIYDGTHWVAFSQLALTWL